MSENNFVSSVESLFHGMDNFITASTVVGEAIQFGDTIILPLVDVTFGVGAGAFQGEKKNNGAGGLGGRLTPSAVLVIKDGMTRMVNIKNQDTITKVIDMVPELIHRFTGKKEEEPSEEVQEAVENAFGE